MDDLGLSFTQITFVIALGGVFFGFSQLPIGILCRYVPRKVILGVGNVILSLANIGMSFASSLGQLLLFRVIGSASSSPQHVAGTSMVSTLFDSKSRGRAIGIHQGLAYVGNILGPPLAVLLLVQFDWRQTLFLVALPIIIVGFLTIALIGNGGKAVVNIDGGPKSSVVSDIKNALKNRTVAMIIVSQTLLTGGSGIGALISLIPLYLNKGLGLPPTTMGGIFTVLLLGGVLGPFILGRFSDTMGRRRIASATIVFSALFLFSLGFVVDVGIQLIITLFLLGVTAFSITSLLMAYLSDITDSSVRDITFGLYWTIGIGCGAMWFPLMGYIIDITGTFSMAFNLMAFLSLCSSVIIFLTRTERKV
jgi:MFS family permease